MTDKLKIKGLKLDKKLNLGSDFPKPTFTEWKKQVENDLKGASFEKKLISKTYEGINLNPIYTREDLNGAEFLDTFPGSGNFARGFSSSGYFGKTWDVKQEIITADVEEFNANLKEGLNNGQNCINLTLDTATKLGLDADYAQTYQVGDYGLSISAINSMKRALNELDLTKLPVYADAGYSNVPFLALMNAYLETNFIDPSKLSGAITADPIAHLAIYGELPVSMDYVFNMMKESLEWTKNNANKLRTIGINVLPFTNGGANSAQELAISLSVLVFYINELCEKGLSPKEILNNTFFTFGIGNNYFMEISKFRAARILLNNIILNYGVKQNDIEFKISAKSSWFYQSNLDPYVNMLRSTTQAFSAILGGIDGLTTLPFDETYREADSFSRRIARNTQTILREESHLDTVIDPAGGSYYVEHLTKELAEKAWNIFQSIERKGGILNALSSGFIHEYLNENFENIRKDINKRKSVIVGTNMFADINENKLKERKLDQLSFQSKRAEYLKKYRLNGTKEKHENIMGMLNSISDTRSKEIIGIITEAYLLGATLGEISSFLNSSHKEKITIEKIEMRRASEDFEKIKNEALTYKESYGELPKVFLANYGTVNEFKARADFSKGFFETGGFQVLESKGSLSIDEIISESIQSNAKIIVLCSTDDNYKTIVKPLAEGIKGKGAAIDLILAGYPKDHVEEYKKFGIDDFIYLGADALEKLTVFHKKIGGDK